MNSHLSIRLLDAYVSAEAYGQARNRPRVSDIPPPAKPNPFPSSSIFFSFDSTVSPKPMPSFFGSEHPYREGPQDFGIPSVVIQRLFEISRKTGRRYSLFRHQNGHGLLKFEIREGFLEESFGAAPIAQIHSPEEGPLPAERDLTFVMEGCWFHPHESFSHIIFGFVNGEPSYVWMTVALNLTKNEVRISLSNSQNLPVENLFNSLASFLPKRR